MSIGPIVAGLIVTIILGCLVERLVNYVEEQVRAQHPDAGPVRPRLAGDRITGFLECLIFFASFAGLGAVLAGAWLVFKTAAKWKTWDSVKDISQIEIFVRYRTFLIGTGANIVAGIAGAAIALAIAG